MFCSHFPGLLRGLAPLPPLPPAPDPRPFVLRGAAPRAASFEAFLLAPLPMVKKRLGAERSSLVQRNRGQ